MVKTAMSYSTFFRFFRAIQSDTLLPCGASIVYPSVVMSSNAQGFAVWVLMLASVLSVVRPEQSEELEITHIAVEEPER